MTPEQVSRWNDELRDGSPLDITRWAIAHANGRAIVSTNFRPYEAVILHLATRAQPRIPVLWVDHGYNRPATYLHAELLRASLNLDLRPYLPRLTAAHRDAIDGPIPDTNDEAALKQFSARMKLEPFQRGMKELAPLVWITALRKVQNPEPRRDSTWCRSTRTSARSRSARCFHADGCRPRSLPASNIRPAERVGLLRSGEGRRETRVRPARGLGRRRR